MPRLVCGMHVFLSCVSVIHMCSSAVWVCMCHRVCVSGIHVLLSCVSVHVPWCMCDIYVFLCCVSVYVPSCVCGIHVLLSCVSVHVPSCVCVCVIHALLSCVSVVHVCSSPVWVCICYCMCVQVRNNSALLSPRGSPCLAVSTLSTKVSNCLGGFLQGTQSASYFSSESCVQSTQWELRCGCFQRQW